MDTNQNQKIMVIGHKNPDTDSICSAIAYAHLKNETDGMKYEACRAGEVNLETAFVLKKFGMEPPRHVFSVKTQVQDINVLDIPGLPKETSMRKSWVAMRDNDCSTQPILDEDGKLLGIITLNDLSRANMDNLSPAVLSDAGTPVRNIVEILNGTVLTGDEDEVITQGTLSIGAGGAETMESIIKEGDIVMVGNRFEAQLTALEAGAHLIVVCLSEHVSKTITKIAEANNCTVIVTGADTYETSRLIVQSVPISAYMTPYAKILGFRPDTPLDEVLRVTGSNRHVYFPVCTDDGKYLGLLSRRDLLKVKGKKLILVDHNEKSQCVDGFEEAEILEIIDHHRIGNMETENPVVFRNMPVGCTATIVTQMYHEKNVKIPPEIAGILLSAILSDTLEFRSPTCTQTDIDTAEELAGIAGVDAHELSQEMFAAGENLDGRSAADVFYQDFKLFTHGDVRFGVGQGSFMSKQNIEKAVNLLEPFMSKAMANDNADMVFFMLTDVIDQSSRILYAGEDAEEIIRQAFRVDAGETGGIVNLPGVVSRKKQIIPAILSALE